MNKKEELASYLDFAKEVAVHAGSLLAKEHGKDHARHYKTRYDFANVMDQRTDKLIGSSIHKRFPDHDIISEETKRRSNGSPWRWYIDPLDGTYNYTNGLDLFAVSIGLSYESKPVVGIIYAPLREELYWASEGGGAFLNGSPINVSKERKLGGAFVGLELGKFDPKAILPYYEKLFRGRRILYAPSYASSTISLTFLASGKIHAYGALKLEPWDMAAGVIIVREAGGRVTDFYGKEWEEGDESFLAANPALHKTLLKRLHT